MPLVCGMSDFFFDLIVRLHEAATDDGVIRIWENAYSPTDLRLVTAWRAINLDRYIRVQPIYHFMFNNQGPASYSEDWRTRIGC